jgi:hypothetical protein
MKPIGRPREFDHELAGKMLREGKTQVAVAIFFEVSPQAIWRGIKRGTIKIGKRGE